MMIYNGIDDGDDDDNNFDDDNQVREDAHGAGLSDQPGSCERWKVTNPSQLRFEEMIPKSMMMWCSIGGFAAAVVCF